jgi:hypothetical protein
VTSAAIFLKKHLAVDFVTGRICGISIGSGRQQRKPKDE